MAEETVVLKIIIVEGVPADVTISGASNQILNL